ncbi:ExbD/TolR family protein [Desulfoplanes sp.]
MIAFSRHRTDRRVEVNMTPLVDIIFILLIFFVLSSIFITRGMDVNLPEATTGDSVSGNPLELVVKADGAIFLDGEKIFPGMLMEVLGREFVNHGGDRKVLLKVEADVTVKRFIRVMDTVRGAGFSNLVIGTRSPDSEGPV